MSKPFLVVRATIDDGMMADFLAWYAKEHLPHVMAIPGVIKAYRSNCRRRGVNWTALYELADEASMQTVIGSSEADRARRDWERWLPYVADLSVEVYAPLAPLSGFHHWN
jgi:hypothetical protein